MSARLLKSLLYKSAFIQQKIEQEQRRRWPDALRLLKLKTLHLTIQERLRRLAQDSLQPRRLAPVRIRNS